MCSLITRVLIQHSCTHNNRNEDELSSVEQKLQNRWRFPTLTIHNVQVSGPSHSNTVIPKSAQAAVSMRLVPDQQLDQIISSFQHHISQSFKRLNSKNRFTLSIGHRADWWVADQNSRVYRLAAQSIREEWGVEPLHIREGGSIPAIPFLEKYFNAPAVHIPLGQASDNAHLPDERIRIQNLLAGVSVIKRFLTKM